MRKIAIQFQLLDIIYIRLKLDYFFCLFCVQSCYSFCKCLPHLHICSYLFMPLEPEKSKRMSNTTTTITSTVPWSFDEILHDSFSVKRHIGLYWILFTNIERPERDTHAFIPMNRKNTLNLLFVEYVMNDSPLVIYFFCAQYAFFIVPFIYFSPFIFTYGLLKFIVIYSKRNYKRFGYSETFASHHIQRFQYKAKNRMKGYEIRIHEKYFAFKLFALFFFVI